MRTMSKRERRLLAGALLIGTIALAWLIVVAPIVNGFADRADRRAQLRMTYAHQQRTIASVPRLRRQAERQRAAIGDFALPTASLDAGRERLRDRLLQTVEGVGGDFRESVDAEGRPGWARVQASARLSLSQLTFLLDRLQNEPPYLIIDSLTIAADEAVVTGKPSALDIQLEASIPLRPAAAR